MPPAGPLSALLLAHLPDPPPDNAGLEEGLQRLLDRCHAAWPDLDLPAPVFLQHIAGLIGGGEAGPALDALHAEDLYLACACAQGLPAACAAFDQQCLAQVPAWLSGRVPPGVLAALAEEVQQALRERLLVAGPGAAPRIARYGGRGRLAAWVRISALRMAVDLGRARGERFTEAREPAALDLLGAAPDPELDLMKARYRDDFEGAFRDALLALSAEQRNLLRLHLVPRRRGFDRLLSVAKVTTPVLTEVRCYAPALDFCG